MRKSTGFTMIELLVAIAIIALLSSIVFASIGNARTKARNKERLGDMRQLQIALEMYQNETQSYPPSPNDYSARDCDGNTGFQDTLQPLVDNGLLPKIPNDPLWPSPNTYPTCYIYRTNFDDSSNGFCGGTPQASPYPYILIFRTEGGEQLSFAPWGNPVNDRYCLTP